MMGSVRAGRMFWVASVAGTGMAALPAVALAHHPLGGATPDNAWHGLLSGIGHPLIGLDHFAFVVAVGIACALSGARVIVPALFILATIAGCLLKWSAGLVFPSAEVVIAGSVLAAGALVMSGRAINPWVLAVVMAIAGLFHGGAYGDAIVGAETTPLGAYLAGFAVIQFAVIGVAFLTARWIERDAAVPHLKPRLAGAVIAGIGLTFLVEHAEKMIFPGM